MKPLLTTTQPELVTTGHYFDGKIDVNDGKYLLTIGDSNQEMNNALLWVGSIPVSDVSEFIGQTSCRTINDHQIFGNSHGFLALEDTEQLGLRSFTLNRNRASDGVAKCRLMM